MKQDLFDKNKPHKNPYQVPEGYFDKKKKQLLAIAEEPTEDSLRSTSYRTLSWITAIAAAIMLGIFFFPINDNQTPLPAPEVSDASIEAYLMQEYPASAINEEMVINELCTQDLEDLNFSNFREDELEEFIDNNFDQTLHYEFL